MADAWFINPHNKLDTTARQFDVYRRALDEAGKPFPAEMPMMRTARDFLFVPAWLPHQEINPSVDQPTEWIVVRSGGEAIVVNLTKAPNGEYVVESKD